jgi:hypothetical protein
MNASHELLLSVVVALDDRAASTVVAHKGTSLASHVINPSA